jgi:site-specific recombinase XerD
MEPRSDKLLDRAREAIQRKRYSHRTAESYISWIKRYIFFHNKRHPQDMDSAEIEAFLTRLAVKEHVAASTQNQALGALLFLYREVLNPSLPKFPSGGAEIKGCLWEWSILNGD